jgi:hypothetical protein
MISDIITGSSRCETIFDLGNIPFVNNLEDTFEDSLNSKKYPLSIVYFNDSKVTRIKDIPETKKLFDKYLYVSGVSEPFKKHCSLMYDYLSENNYIKDYDFVIDIGGNDGTLLTQFRNKNSNLRLVNIEPSSVYKKSKENNIETYNSYFSESCLSLFDKKPNLIITTNVFQHLYDIKTFAENIKNLLHDNGFWCLEFPYWLHTMSTMQFDQIYHEHIYYYNVQPLITLFEQVGLKVANVSKQYIHGGSLRLLVCKKNNPIVCSHTVEDILTEEAEIPSDFYKNWKLKLETHLSFCKEQIINIAKTNKICGFGAAAKGCIFLNYLNINHQTLPFVIDDTDIKQGKFIPGTGIKVIDRNSINYKDIDYILILAHNFADYIIDSLRKDGYLNKFIVCFPDFKIIE